MSNEVVLVDMNKEGRTVLGGCLLLAVMLFGIGFAVDGGFRIALFVGGCLATAFVAFFTIVILWGPKVRLLLGPKGLVKSRGQREDVLPAEAIRSVGLLVDGGQTTFLVVSYDLAVREGLSKVLRGYEIKPGLLRLSMVGDEGFGYLPIAKIAEVRAVVQACGLGEWRDHSSKG
ncbi:MAG: hypothetical protein JWO67_5820 [Streptosporangiaceae bacterium]|nr:hypothetical protein [Streptosporangiaceae bacterium]